MNALRRSGCLALIVALGCRSTGMSLDPQDAAADRGPATLDAGPADVAAPADASDLGAPPVDVLQGMDVPPDADLPLDVPVVDLPTPPDMPPPMDLGAPVDVGTDTGAPVDVMLSDVPRNDVGPLTAGIGEGLSPDARPERRVTCGGVVPPAPRVTAGAADRYVLRGRVVTPAGVLAPGEVFITGATITCVAASCAARTGYAGATIIETGGVIAPGMVDTHNHPQYNFLPPWPPPRRFTRSDQWQGVPEYRAFTEVLRNNENLNNNTCAMTKWGELRALVAGTTTIQGAPNQNCITRTLARNIESGNDFGGVDTHRPNTLGIATVDSADAMTLRADTTSGRLTAYMLHLSEGIDEPARREFDQLVARDLVIPSMVIIHGTALGVPEFTRLGAARARLVWSPRSNIILYGRTTDVGLALDQGMTVALAPDWSPSGGPNLLSELRYGRYVSQEAMAGRLTSRDLVEMVTSRAATAVDRPQVGALVEGRYADVMVVPDRGCDAYDTLIDAPTADVRLVVLNGRPMYGDAALLDALPEAARARCEPVSICGLSKTICVALPPSSSYILIQQTLADIETQLRVFTTPYPLVPLCP
ncbi:MAG: amidohydrolase family protein [Deltaproteobacteria bacterium]|nr:amidohydrolase family protein [Myxococcales bacterium]MDP3219478.1 amidohydrolase family protein [Deltaproteobacteria bacterium]